MPLPLGVGGLLSPSQRSRRAARSLLLGPQPAETEQVPTPLLAASRPMPIQDQRPDSIRPANVLSGPVLDLLGDAVDSMDEWLRDHPDIYHALRDAPKNAPILLPSLGGIGGFRFQGRPITVQPPSGPAPTPIAPVPSPSPADPLPGQQIPEPPQNVRPSRPPGNIPPKTTRIPVAAGPEPFIKGFTDFILESNPHGRLGNPLTREANQILLEACKQAAADKYWMFEHIGGASEPEQFLRDLDSKTTKGGSFPDLSFDATLQNGQIVRVPLNTVTTLKDGKTPTKNEQRRLTNLERKMHERRETP
ncbi:MAG: hypothetical protein U1E53_03910 [Dongiaceae bacterium]